MAPKLTPDDPRVTHHTAPIRGKTYQYVLALPPGGRAPQGTILLIHGFPDLGFGWRNQVPLLADELGLAVIVPDMLGYGRTDAPDAVAPYAHKSVCADLVALVDHVGVVDGSRAAAAGSARRFFVGGHDWGGAVAWRMVLWHGARLRGVFSVCTPFFAPSKGAYRSLADQATLLPNFAYQQQFAGDALWQFVEGNPARIRQFLLALYGGQAAGAGQSAALPLFDTAHGVYLDRLHRAGPSPLLSPAETDFYAAEFARHGLRGPTNWYRTGKLNWEDERALATRTGDGGGGKITVPALMLTATSDSALPPSLTEQMGRHFTNLRKALVPGGHWVLWQSSAAVNEQIKAFLGPLLDGTAKAAL